MHVEYISKAGAENKKALRRRVGARRADAADLY